MLKRITDDKLHIWDELTEPIKKVWLKQADQIKKMILEEE